MRGAARAPIVVPQVPQEARHVGQAARVGGGVGHGQVVAVRRVGAGRGALAVHDNRARRADAPLPPAAQPRARQRPVAEGGWGGSGRALFANRPRPQERPPQRRRRQLLRLQRPARLLALGVVASAVTRGSAGSILAFFVRS